MIHWWKWPILLLLFVGFGVLWTLAYAYDAIVMQWHKRVLG